MCAFASVPGAFAGHALGSSKVRIFAASACDFSMNALARFSNSGG